MNDKDALEWLYGQLRRKWVALGRAEEKPNVDPGEIESLQDSIAVIEWLIGVVLERGWEGDSV